MHFIIYDHGTGMKDALFLIKIIVSYDTVAMYLCALIEIQNRVIFTYFDVSFGSMQSIILN